MFAFVPRKRRERSLACRKLVRTIRSATHETLSRLCRPCCDLYFRRPSSPRPAPTLPIHPQPHRSGRLRRSVPRRTRRRHHRQLSRPRRPLRLLRQPPRSARSGNELLYDFEKNYTTTVTTGSGTTITSNTYTSRLRPLTGLFGPRFQVGTSGPLRAFITAKGGFIEFSYSNNAASGSSFATALNQFNNGGTTHFAADPAAASSSSVAPSAFASKPATRSGLNNGPSASAPPSAPPSASSAYLSSKTHVAS